MTPAALDALRGLTVVDPDPLAFAALGISRTLGYRLLRENDGQLCEGVRALRVGTRWKVPVKSLLHVLGYSEEPHTCACRMERAE